MILQAHSNLSDMERKNICSLMDCQKLSPEACAHAAQNHRLPVQTVVQVLYYKQQRLLDTMDGDLISVEPTALSSNNEALTDELSCLKKENQDLKFELLKMKLKLKMVERSSLSPVDKSAVPSPISTRIPADKPPLPQKSFMNSLTKHLGKLTPFLRPIGFLPLSTRGSNRPSKNRRHSIS